MNEHIRKILRESEEILLTTISDKARKHHEALVVQMQRKLGRGVSNGAIVHPNLECLVISGKEL